MLDAADLQRPWPAPPSNSTRARAPWAWARRKTSPSACRTCSTRRRTDDDRVPAGEDLVRRYLQQRLKFRHLRVIDAIVTHESILQAAKALGLSQPALTKSLQEVEEIVGARLFDRHARGADPTAFGLTVAASARRLLAEIGRLEDELDALEGGDGGPVVVGALPVAAAGVLPGALARLKIARPDIEVRVIQGRTEELISQLTLREIDLVIGRLYEMPQDDGLVRTPFYSEPISVLARHDHPIFASGDPTPAALADYSLVLPTVSQRVGQEIDVLLAEMGSRRASPCAPARWR
jgi:LysR family pca operon transcriptional activator